jgi:hypothetical protein
MQRRNEGELLMTCRRHLHAPRGAWLATAVTVLAAVGCGDDTTGGTGGGSATGTTTSTGSSTGSTGSTSAQTGSGGAPGTGGGDAGGGDVGGGASTTELPYGSGTRLRARLLDAGDGAVSFTDSFLDGELETICYPTPAIDGVVTCVPPTRDVKFADADCTQPVIESDPCEERDFASRVEGAGDCGAGTQVYYRRTEEASDADELFTLGPAGCESAGVPTEDVFVAEEIPASTFVRGTVEIEPLEGGLSRVLHAFEDGAYRGAGVVDDELDVECHPYTQDDELICLALPAYTGDGYRWFADDSCTAPAAVNYLGECSPGFDARAVVEYSEEECGFGTFLYEAGEAITTFYSNEDGSCGEVVDDNYVAYRVGAAADLSTFPAMSRLSAGDGRITLEGTGVGDTWTDGYGGFFDTELDTRCSPAEFEDGSTRCVSYASSNGGWYYFADDACTVPLHEHLDSGCDVETQVALIPDSGDGCFSNVISEIRLVGDPYDGTVYGLDNLGDCTEIDASTVTLRELGPARPSDDFVEVTLVVE